MSEWWSPKPRKEMNLGGIFSYEEPAVTIEKGHNRWKAQRDADGTPHTRTPQSALSPALVGPSLYVGDMVEKAIPADSNPAKDDHDPEEVVKGYLILAEDMYLQGKGDIVKAATSKVKSLSEEDPEDEIAK